MNAARALLPLPRRWYRVYAATLFVALLALAAAVVPARSDAAGPARAARAARAARSADLVGTLELSPGSCSGGKVTGTYLRMILPSGGANGPYLSNNDSRCSDKSFTTLAPGTDGGLRLGSYQPPPSPAFTSSGDARARRITGPTGFYGTNFSLATSPVDPQTRARVPAPRVTVTGSSVTADLRSFAVTWNKQNFNQGAPKPDGSTPGNTHRATGSYDAATGLLTLSWASQVVGGPFDKFTGAWHVEGRFVPARGTSAPSGPAPGNSGTASGTGAAGAGAGTPASPAGTAAGSTSAAASGTSTGTGTAPAPDAGSPASPSSKPGAFPVTSDGAQPVAAPATVKTVTTDRWKVSVPVLALTAGIAVLGFAALIGLHLAGRRATKP